MNRILKMILTLLIISGCGWSQLQYKHKEVLKDSEVTKKEIIKLRSFKHVKNIKDLPAILDSNIKEVKEKLKY